MKLVHAVKDKSTEKLKKIFMRNKKLENYFDDINGKKSREK